ncbi:MAG: demethoxyubiquinone hydroxylase family protein [Rhodospirillaceae bacterium]|nr:demethoxyubiquinone hydroxylase family protein [Rhodospirillaceae bacterium]
MKPQPRPEPSLDALMPGDPSREETVARMIRVDQAGEYGAARIYAGQLAVLGRSKSAPTLRRMAEQERKHLAEFDRLMIERRVRPTALQPLWHMAGFALGAATALMGEKAAMACTVAVEETIDAHYRKQAAQLGGEEPALKDRIEEFREDELEHRATALEHGAAEAPGYAPLVFAIKRASRLAIWLSERF